MDISLVQKPWGTYKVLHEDNNFKIKELIVMPNASLSMQRHQQRSELWLVVEGKCEVLTRLDNGYQLPNRILKTFDSFTVKKMDWHQLYNPYKAPCKLIEIQYGDKCVEEDIIRL